MAIQVRRIYDPPAASDGYRVLVDRLWPRGLSKERAAIDEWLREVSPSTALRHWFEHDPAKWDEFNRRYAEELAAPAAVEAIARLRELDAGGTVTLLYSATERAMNNAVALAEYLAGQGEHG